MTRASHSPLLGLLLLGLAQPLLQVAQAGSLQSVTEIRDFLYQQMKYSGGWYKLLNSTSETGSQAPVWGQSVSAPLLNASHTQWPLTDKRILVCNLTNFETVLQLLLSDPVSRSNAVGVLVDPNGPLPSHMSSAPPFPGSFNAPYSNQAYPWNPAGSGLALQHINLPVILLSTAMAAQVTGRATYNNDNSFKGALYWGKMQLDMTATSNSSYCTTMRTCKPLGGVSLWAAVPPMQPLYPDLPTSQMQSGNGSLVAPSSKSITVVTAQIDSNSLFHDYTQGSESPLSGLISMMAAMEILRVTNASSTYSRQLVFMALAGEPWDYMGSRRLMWEMSLNTTPVSGLDMSRIDQVIEVGQVGRAYSASLNASNLYLHRQQPDSGYGDTTALAAAVQLAATQTSETQVSVTLASSSNPGIPPSSLMTFLRHNRSIQGLVLADFDRQYTNPYYQSERDEASPFLSVDAMVAAGVTLARTLHTLASPSAAAAPLVVNASAIYDLVLRLANCLMVDGPAPNLGLWCSTVSSYLPQGVSYSNQNAAGVLQPIPWRYVGLFMADTPDPTNVTNIQAGRDIFKFLFQWMGNTTASSHTSIPCDPYINFCPSGMVCLGWQSGQNISANVATMGRCKRSTTRIVQATSTRVIFFNTLTEARYVVMNETEPYYVAFNQKYGWPADPLWAESDWTSSSPSVMVYMAEPYNTQVAILVSGLLLTAATGLAAYFIQRAFENRLKSE